MPKLRKRLLLDEWVILAPERADRPRHLDLSLSSAKADTCPFCPENEAITPPTIASWRSEEFAEEPWAVRAIPNKFPALRVEEPAQPHSDRLYESIGGVGAHEVIIESPRHDTSWESLSATHLALILGAWRERMTDLRGDRRLRCAMLFKNHGARAGATLAHVHSQLIALPLVPSGLQAELDGARQYFEDTGRCAICDMLKRERQSGERLVIENEAAVAVAPYASRTPFEIWILPRDHHGDFMAADPSLVAGIAELIEKLLPLWSEAIGPVAYNLVLHCLPFDLLDEPYYHWHLELLPRTGQVAGFEWSSNIYINPTPSEVAARHLRNLASRR